MRSRDAQCNTEESPQQNETCPRDLLPVLANFALELYCFNRKISLLLSTCFIMFFLIFELNSIDSLRRLNLKKTEFMLR